MFITPSLIFKKKITRELRPLNSRTSGFLWGVEQIAKIIAVTFVYGRTRQYSNISKNTEHGDTEVYLCYGCLGCFFFFILLRRGIHVFIVPSESAQEWGW